MKWLFILLILHPILQCRESRCNKWVEDVLSQFYEAHYVVDLIDWYVYYNSLDALNYWHINKNPFQFLFISSMELRSIEPKEDNWMWWVQSHNSISHNFFLQCQWTWFNTPSIIIWFWAHNSIFLFIVNDKDLQKKWFKQNFSSSINK